MPAVTQTDQVLKFSWNGTDYACQIINGSFTPPAPGEATPVPVACGDTVSEPGDPQSGEITGEVFKDSTTAGFTRALIAAAMAGTEIDFEWTENDGTAHELTFIGKAVPQPPTIDFQPAKLGRHQFTLTVTSAALSPLA